MSAVEVALASAVVSYVGLQLSMSSRGHPVVLSTLSPPARGGSLDIDECRPALTSLRVPLVLLDGEFEPADQIVIFAATPGSLVDLAADLIYLARGVGTSGTQARLGAGARPGRPRAAAAAIALDADLPSSKVDPGLRGLSQLSDISRAEGVMIHHGHRPDEVGAALRRQAAGSRLPPHAFAVAVLHGLISFRGEVPLMNLTNRS